MVEEKKENKKELEKMKNIMEEEKKENKKILI